MNPITRKRLARFRSMKRAYVSLWCLGLLYLLSLVAGLICNNRPLYVRYEGKSYFPAFKFYTESTFVPGGSETRPNYKAIAATAAFIGNNDNKMVFTPVPFGPLESIDPETLRNEKRVTISIRPIPHVGNVNIDRDFAIQRSREADYFLGAPSSELLGQDLTQTWQLDQAFRDGIVRRFNNKAAPPMIATLIASDSGLQAELSLSRYKQRSRPATTVRITFRDVGGKQEEALRLTYDAEGNVTKRPGPAWLTLSDRQYKAFRLLATRRFAAPVYPTPIVVAGKQCAVDDDFHDVAWPYKPVRGHWMGIDNAGRDVFARLIYGLRISMTFGFILVLLSMLIGILIGAIQGYFGGFIDITGQRLIEIWSAIPFLYVMILLGSVFGRSFGLLLFCYGIFNWIGISYYMRAEFLRLRGQAYVDAARCLGVRTPGIMFRHILPNAITPIITFFPFSLVGAIGSLAALDYLGFGLPPPTPSWGELLQQAQEIRWAWWLILYPSLALFTVMLLGVFVGEGVREAFDPRKYSRLQ